MTVYRLTKRRYASDLTGTGGLLAAGRCNAKGTPAIYAAQYVSLALAEVLVHLDVDEVPDDYVLVTIDIPEHVSVLRTTPEQALRLSISSPVPIVQVPSVIVPREFNLVMYPKVVGFEASVRDVEPFGFDERLFRQRRSRE